MASHEHRPTTSVQDVWEARSSREIHNLRPHPVTGRLIDNYPGKRTRPMKLLVLGMSRTGTMSLLTALESPGMDYRVYHMAKAIAAPRANFYTWIEGLRAKYHGVGKPWGREEFDKILGDFDAVADVPCICFYEELIRAYPEAKVVLNTRDVDSWLKSMQAGPGLVSGWPSWKWVAPWDKALVEPWYDFMKFICPAFFKTLSDYSPQSPARSAFLEHYENIKKVCPPERLLEYRVQDGWEPLAKFLGKPVPQGEFPRINDGKQFVQLHATMWYLALGKMISKVSSALVIPAAAVFVAHRQGALSWLWP